jgi:hypothetical protein
MCEAIINYLRKKINDICCAGSSEMLKYYQRGYKYDNQTAYQRV